jgi:hypothetical protein
MAYDKTGPADPHHVNVRQDYEIRYWTKELRCTPNQLRDAVKASGTSVEAVRAYLAKL